MSPVDQSIEPLLRGFYLYRLLRFSYFHVAIGILYFQSCGLTLVQSLSVESVYYVAKSVFDLPGGYFADRLGRKSSLLTSSLICAAAYLTIGLSSTYAMFALASVMLGLAMSLSTSSDSALLYDELQARNALSHYEKAEARGWGMRNFGFAVASAAGAWIAAMSTLAIAFFLSAGVIATSTLFVMRYMHEPHFRGVANRASWLKAMREVAVQPRFYLTVAFFAVIFVVVRIGFWSFQPILSHLGIDTKWFGALFGLTLFVTLFATLRIEWMRRVRGGPWVVLGALCSTCFLIVGLGVAKGGALGFLVVMLGFLVHAVAFGLYDPAMRRSINDMADGSVRASAISVVSMIGNLGFAAFAPIFGYLIERVGHAPTLFGIGLVMIGLTAVFVRWQALSGTFE